MTVTVERETSSVDGVDHSRGVAGGIEDGGGRE